MSGSILAIDPGPTMSAFAIIDPETRAPLDFGKCPNDELLASFGAFIRFGDRVELAAIEMVSSYGMAVGAEVFDTCVWAGRFLEALTTEEISAGLVTRRLVKLHHCHSARATDANIRQALVDRFAPGQPNGGKGTKASPGFFHGIKADVWQAYALAVYIADMQNGDYQ